MKYVKKLVNEGHSLAWTLAGTALVLITRRHHDHIRNTA